MRNNLNALFEKLSSFLVSARSPLIDLFQDSIDKTKVNRLIDGLSITFPEEVFTLYNWHNGTRGTEDYTLGQLWIFPLGIFVPIERSIEGYKYYAGKDGHWKIAMFMLFEGGGGEMFLIDCDSKSSTYRQILKHDYGAVDHDIVTPIFDSLESLFHSVIECLQEKAFYYNEKGILKSDVKLYIPIMKKNNPNSKYWNIDGCDE